MPANAFRCKLVTPTAALMDDKVTYASVPAFDGLLGVQAGRAPMLIALGLGELRLDIAEDGKGKGGSRSYLVDGGFVKMSSNELTILAERAIPSESISPSDAQAELTKLLSEKPKDSSVASTQALHHQQDVARLKVSMAAKQRGI